VVGDFGLADFDGKQDLTTNDRRIGAMYFHAPEMLTNPAGSAGPPADVYSLAKTLWVLAMNQRWPPLGYQRREYLPNLLEVSLFRPDAAPLDVLLEAATHDSPPERPSLRLMSDELFAWLRVPRKPAVLSHLDEYRGVLDATRNKAARDQRVAEMVNAELEGGVSAVVEAVVGRLEPVGRALFELGEEGEPRTREALADFVSFADHFTALTPSPPATLSTATSRSVSYVLGAVPRGEIVVGVFAYSDRTIQLALLVTVSGKRQSRVLRASISPMAAIGSSRLAASIESITDQAIGSLEPLLQAIADALRTGDPP
jgi:hypothetical protein